MSEHGTSVRSGQGMKAENSFFKSFRYAAQGVAQAAGERNFKFDLVAAAIALLACAVLQVQPWGWAVVVVCIGVQLGMEALNTAVEAVVDLASPELHPLAKRAKDCAAGAAFLTAIACACAGLIVYVCAIARLLGF